ncbi:hypothetical protein DEU37_2348 [Microbacterium sp. AG790]|uniref:hypothetical protein n=1 Tax=Microbacterium sp. AG790 TaxID=2183995 RepID=UPI000EACABFF|nr:hypothetical protein [Microbacterium sp. AG790]RKS86694.1 hypothetical protein DEU37_2348 [Microbacterium sp. AG790]
MKFRRYLAGAAAAATSAVLIGVLGASGASAASPNFNADIALFTFAPTIQPGGSGTMAVIATNLGPDTLDAGAWVAPLKFTAPAGATFSLPLTFHNTDPASGLTAETTSAGCTLQNGNTELICSGVQFFGSGTAPAQSIVFDVPITIDASVPANSVLNGFTVSLTPGSTWVDSNPANNTNIPGSVTVGTPAISWPAAGGALFAGLMTVGIAFLITRRRRASADQAEALEATR